MDELSPSSSSLVLENGTSSGLTINLHPLAILNISDHVTRDRLTGSKVKVTGALLGTIANRQVSVVNSFELSLASGSEGDDTELIFDQDFFERRKEQYKQVFPTLEVIGWYSIGSHPNHQDLKLHEQITSFVDTPIFLLFDNDMPTGAKDLPLTIYESALSDGSKETDPKAAGGGGKFVKLEYGVETGEAERIAVDGATRGGMGAQDDDQVVGSLITQRNAIRMLYERISVLLSYVQGVASGKASADHTILRQISALLAGLPTMDAALLKSEMADEYADAQVADTFTNLTKQLSALNDYTDRHHQVYPPGGQEDFGQAPRGAKGSGAGGNDAPYRRRR